MISERQIEEISFRGSLVRTRPAPAAFSPRARRILPRSLSSKRLAKTAQLLKEQADRLNSAVKIRDVEFFVGSVQIVVRKAKAHHDRGNLQHVLKIGDNRYRAT